MVKRIQIKGYKSYKDLEISLNGINVVIGPNGAGKSNLLDAISLISKIATSKNLNQAFDEHRGGQLESFYYGENGFEELLKRDRASMSFEVDVELSERTVQETTRLIKEKRKGLDTDSGTRKLIAHTYLRYFIEIEVLPKTGVLRVIDEKLLALKKNDGLPKRSRPPFIVKTSNRRISLRMEGHSRPTEFEVGLDHAILSTSLYEPHHPHIIAFRTELENWKTYYLEPRILMRQEVPVAEITSIGPRGENLPAFLNLLKETNPVSYDNYNKTVKQILPLRPDVNISKNPRDGLLGLNFIENDISYSSNLVSEGTLRVLGLIAALRPENKSTLIGYEEPENGIHPVRIKQMAEMLKNTSKLHGKQLIITTHSPLFAQMFTEEANRENTSVLVCQKIGSESSLKPLEAFGPLYAESQLEIALSDMMLRGDFGG